MTRSAILVRSLTPADSEWAARTLEQTWGSVFVARKGELIDVTQHPGFVATIDAEPVGLAHMVVRGLEYEVLSLSAFPTGQGIGRALLSHCVSDARDLGCRRVWLTTTNNNIRAIAFYQRMGFDLCALHRHGVDVARELKPSIALRDEHGVRIAHELEFELLLETRA
ncbi:MAG: GNAT family N-acetyltransferase [Candidatus Nanopelagicales bacterium]